ncbi:type IV pilin [Haloarcula litorea]|uniref:type IV pilin n=1 Tax=Haloarcula litorea TaxID=3032579 RepID=UPI0023E81580|nr:type IV pilin [Halomicroarcula sp. GDY20]
MTRSLGDARAMSESIGVAVLVGMTVVVTAMVGVNVLVADTDSGGVEGSFSYDYVEDSELLVVTYADGDPLAAGNVRFEGPRDAGASWAALSGRNNSSTVEPGDIAQLSSGNAYGQRVSAGDTIVIYYNTSANSTKLDEWSGN